MKLIPWDVWIALVCASAVLSVILFELVPGLFLAISVALCIYIGLKTFSAKAE
ncbi:MAG: hypothetical protein WBD48_06190 [Pseudolabrys sp.]|jgi:hypothetical protein